MEKAIATYEKKILIVDDIHQVFMDKLDQAGIGYSYRPAIGREEALALLHGFDGLVIRSKFKVDRPFLERVPHLRLIARGGAGMDNIDEDYARHLGIHLRNAPEGNRDAVGEHMVGMLLALVNHYARADKEVRSGHWLREENRGEELMGKTVGIIGYGHNGQAMAKKLSGFGLRVLAYDKYMQDYADAFAAEATLAQIFAQADVLSLHIPLTHETQGMVDELFLEKFKRPIYFLNGSRGEIVSIPSVLKAIGANRIKGAAFDVLPVEKFPALSETDWYATLASNEKVLLSPHVAGWTVESYYKIAAVLGDKVVDFYKSVGQRP